jgi:hypothetical protein
MKYFRLSLCCALLATAFSVTGMRALADSQADPDETVAEAMKADQDFNIDRSLQRLVRIGFKIAPVPLDLQGKSEVLVGLGSYLVNAVGGCNDCHTNPSFAPDGNPFLGQPKKINVAGYLAGGQQFGPGIVSRNLTPENGLPAGRTFAQFKQIIRTGIDLDKAHPQYGPLLQVMPWPDFQDMSTRDLLAIYTYLSAIPPLTPAE